MDLHGMQNVVLTLENIQIWLVAPLTLLQFNFAFFHFVVQQMSLREKHSIPFSVTVGN